MTVERIRGRRKGAGACTSHCWACGARIHRETAPRVDRTRFCGDCFDSLTHWLQTRELITRMREGTIDFPLFVERKATPYRAEDWKAFVVSIDSARGPLFDLLDELVTKANAEQPRRGGWDRAKLLEQLIGNTWWSKCGEGA